MNSHSMPATSGMRDVEHRSQTSPYLVSCTEQSPRFSMPLGHGGEVIDFIRTNQTVLANTDLLLKGHKTILPGKLTIVSMNTL